MRFLYAPHHIISYRAVQQQVMLIVPHQYEWPRFATTAVLSVPWQGDRIFRLEIQADTEARYWQ